MSNIPYTMPPIVSTLSLVSNPSLQQDLCESFMEEDNMGTLSIFSSEILDGIVGYLVDDIDDLTRGLRVSWDFRDLIMRARSSTERPLNIGKGRVILSSFFRLFPNVRHVRGGILLSATDETRRLTGLEFLSERLVGNFKVYLQGAYDGTFLSAPGLLRSIGHRTLGIRATPDISRLRLEGLVMRLLEIAKAKIKRDPQSLMIIHLSKFLRIRYRQGRCQLYLPVNVDLGKDKISTGVIRSLRAFFQEVPIAYLLFYSVIMDSQGHLRQASEPQICETILQSPVIDTLTTLTIFSGLADPLLEYIWRTGGTDSIHLILPNVHSLRIRSCNSRAPGALRDTLSHPSLLQNRTFRHQITTIHSSELLHVGETASDILILYPNVRSWNILVSFTSFPSSNPIPVQIRTLEDLTRFTSTMSHVLRTQDTIMKCRALETFWKTHPTHTLYFWYQA